MKFKLKIIIILCVLFIFPISLNAEYHGEDIYVEADGYGSSKSDALLKAKREAVENGIGVILISQTEVRNFELKKDIILSETIGAVKKYEILHEEIQPDNVYYVKIGASVSLASIKKDLVALKILLESMDKPRMMIMIREKEGNSAENTIIDYLTAKGFDLVDASTVAALMQKDDLMIQKAIQGDPLVAAKLGTANGAEYVIVGDVKTSLMQSSLLNSSGMKSVRANITVKVINCSNAQIIASKSSSNAAYHKSEDMAKIQAVEKSAKNLMDRELFEQIVSSFQDMVNNGMPIDITVNNVENYKTQKAFQKALEVLPDMVSVNIRSFGRKQLKLDVLYKGNTDTLCENIDGKKIEGKRMSVTGISGNAITVDIE